MTTEFTEGASCKGKHGFSSYREAKNSIAVRKKTIVRNGTPVIAIIRSDKRFGRKNLKVYRCHFCNRYHTGNGHRAHRLPRHTTQERRGYQLPNPRE